MYFIPAFEADIVTFNTKLKNTYVYVLWTEL